jgi:hypothetical protein
MEIFTGPCSLTNNRSFQLCHNVSPIESLRVQGISFEMAPGNTTVDTGGELVEGFEYCDFTLSFPTQNIDFMNSPPVSLLGLPIC